MGGAHDGQVDAERDLRGRMPQPMTGRTVPEAMGSSPLAPGPRRLLIKAGMLNASPQMPQRRLPGQSDNEIPWTVGRGLVGEQAGQVGVQRDGPASAALAAADQQGAGR